MKCNIRRRAAALLLVGAALVATPRAEIIEQVLVKVNGEIFTKTDLEARQVTALRALGQQVDPASKPSDAQLKKMVDDVTPQLLVSVVDELLLVQRGKELGYTLSDDQFKNIVDNIRKENKIETDEAFQAALKQENMTMADLRRSLERQMMMSRVTQSEVVGKIAVTDEELHRYYDAHLKDFTTVPVVTLREVLIAASAGSPGESDAKRRADAIRERALAGESFEKLAADLSDAPSRANGGLVGPLSLEDLASAVREVVEPLKVGEMTPVLRTTVGYQLLKLDSSTPKQTKSFDQAREQVGDKVFEEKQAVESRKYLEKLRAQSIIEWKNSDLQKAYEAALQKVNAPKPAAPLAQ